MPKRGKIIDKRKTLPRDDTKKIETKKQDPFPATKKAKEARGAEEKE